MGAWSIFGDGCDAAGKHRVIEQSKNSPHVAEIERAAQDAYVDNRAFKMERLSAGMDGGRPS